MMEFGDVLMGLVRQTNAGKLKWSRAAQSDRFVTCVDAISIIIVESNDYDSTTYRLDILDESGDTVESLDYQDTTPEQDGELARLFVLARRSAHNIDATLEKLAKALDL